MRHSLNHMPAVGSAGLDNSELREGYCATLCFVTTDGEFVDIHVTPQHLEYLARLLGDVERFTSDKRFLEQRRREQ